MNWKIIEDACKCELQTFLTWEDAAKYMFNKKLDKKLFSIVPYNSLQIHSRLHKFLVLEDLSKCDDFKDAVYIKDVKKFRAPLLKTVRYMKSNYYSDGVRINCVEPAKGSEHKTHLTDTLNNKIYL